MSKDVSTSKKRKSRKKSKKISFDEEIVPKDAAHTKIKTAQDNIEINRLKSAPKRNKKQKVINEDKASEDNRKGKKQKWKEDRKLENEVINNEEAECVEDAGRSADKALELDPANPTIQKEESKRAKKRKKHQELLSQKKLKVDLVLQEKSLNYLSRWKHNRDEWKFEKLRQIWLQQNMFDGDRIPDQFWKTLIEYFSNAKGKIRQIIVNEALKIVEKSKSEETEENTTEDEDEDQLNKVQRAKDVIQGLQ